MPFRDSTTVSTTSAVSVQALAKKYGARTVLKSIDLEIEPGIIFGLLGPNGAGKSTLLESLAGLRKPTSGSISVLGLDPRRERKRLTALVSVQPQSANVFGYLTVLETLRLYSSFHVRHRDVRQTIVDIGLTDQEQVQARDLSGGQLRRLLFGVAIIGDPRLVILDEPSAGLDPEAREQLLTLIRSLKQDGTTVIFSTHDMVEAYQICDRVVIMSGGKVRADGAPSHLVDDTGSTATVHFEVATPEALDHARSILKSETLTWSEDPRGFHVRYETPNPDAALELLARSRAVNGRRYRVERLTLEDLYLSIVREARNADETTMTDA